VPEFPFVYLNHGPLEPESLHQVDSAWIAFAEPVSAEGAAAVSAEVEAWVLGIHEQASIAFVIGPSQPVDLPAEAIQRLDALGRRLGWG